MFSLFKCTGVFSFIFFVFNVFVNGFYRELPGEAEYHGDEVQHASGILLEEGNDQGDGDRDEEYRHLVPGFRMPELAVPVLNDQGDVDPHHGVDHAGGTHHGLVVHAEERGGHGGGQCRQGNPARPQHAFQRPEQEEERHGIHEQVHEVRVLEDVRYPGPPRGGGGVAELYAKYQEHEQEDDREEVLHLIAFWT